MKKIYVNVGTQVGELLSVDSRNVGGKYRVHIKGDKEPTNHAEVGTRISKTLYDEHAVATKQPTKRSKKS